MAPLSEPPPVGSEAGQDPPLVRVRPPGPMSIGWAARLERSESPAFGARRETRARVAGEKMAPVGSAPGSGSDLVDVHGNLDVDLARRFGALLLGHANAQVALSLPPQADR